MKKQSKIEQVKRVNDTITEIYPEMLKQAKIKSLGRYNEGNGGAEAYKELVQDVCVSIFEKVNSNPEKIAKVKNLKNYIFSAMLINCKSNDCPFSRKRKKEFSDNYLEDILIIKNKGKENPESEYDIEDVSEAYDYEADKKFEKMYNKISTLLYSANSKLFDFGVTKEDLDIYNEYIRIDTKATYRSLATIRNTNPSAIHRSITKVKEALKAYNNKYKTAIQYL